MTILKPQYNNARCHCHTAHKYHSSENKQHQYQHSTFTIPSTNTNFFFHCSWTHFRSTSLDFKPHPSPRRNKLHSDVHNRPAGEHNFSFFTAHERTSEAQVLTSNPTPPRDATSYITTCTMFLLAVCPLAVNRTVWRFDIRLSRGRLHHSFHGSQQLTIMCSNGNHRHTKKLLRKTPNEEIKKRKKTLQKERDTYIHIQKIAYLKMRQRSLK